MAILITNSQPIAVSSAFYTQVLPKMTIFRSPYHIQIPDQDILTFIFSSTKFHDDDQIWIDPIHPDLFVTLSMARDLTQRIGWALRNLGIGREAPGKDIVLSFIENQVLVAPTVFGVLCAEGVHATCSPAATEFELARQISLSKPKLLICSSQTKSVAKQAIKRSGHDIAILEMHSDVLDLRSESTGKSVLTSHSLPWKSITDGSTLKERVACVIYSSGTTG